MPSYTNISNNVITVNIGGMRKQIFPNQSIIGPSNIGMIPGMAQSDKAIKPLPKLENTTPKASLTDFNDAVNKELEYHKKFSNANLIPSVTIAILTKNSYKLISDCCDSILAKVKYKNCTLMICDTGTTDEKVLNYYIELKLKCEQLGFRYREHKMKFYHYSKNYNEVGKLIDTDYFLIQNNDTVALNDYVTMMMRVSSFRKVSSTGPRMYYPDGRIQHDGQMVFLGPNGTCDGRAGHLNLGMYKKDLPERYNKTVPVDGNTAAGCLVRTEDFIKVGGFDEAYHDIYQDVDFMLKLANTDPIRNNYNLRLAEIIHIDNASRKGEERKPNLAELMQSDQLRLVSRCRDNGWKLKTEKTLDFSIVTVVRDLNVYKNLLDCFRNQEGSHSAEIIGIPNYNNLYENIFDALNDACDVAEGKYIIYCHEDILVKNDWLHKIKNIINNLESRSIKWGVLGPAGINKNMTSTNYHLLDKDLEELSIEQNNRIETFEEACALDEMCLIIKKSTGLRFSNKVFKGFHFYAADICAISNSLGFKNFSINAPVYHASDGFKNISTEETFIEYVNMALTAERFMNKLNIKEWRTTTLYSTNEKLIIYAVPENLKEKYGSPLIFNKPLQFDKVTK